MLIDFPYLFKKYDMSVDGIVHCGSNDAAESTKYFECGVEKVIWIDALPKCVKQAKENTKQFQGHQVLQACLSDRDGEKVTFNVASNQGQSSSFLEFGTHAKHHSNVRFVDKIEMMTTRLDTLFMRNQICLNSNNWLGNLDLQGVELLALKGMGALIHHFKYLYLEANLESLYKNCALEKDLLDFLCPMGFVLKERKFTNWKWGDIFLVRE